uniref:PPM-type phosphatase domain-containing protein n=1 Tax=Haptolina ericina TaxID=156174 RepID=A0A7S3AX32_9EUKA
MLSRHHRWLLAQPEEALRYAFREAHLAIQKAIMGSNPQLRMHEGSGSPYILQWMEEDGEYSWDAVDGGTTVTVVVALRGQDLFVATVGDSAVVMLGRTPSGSPVSELLIAEHTPTSVSEYTRMRNLNTGSQVKFIYDCPDYDEDINIFRDDDSGSAVLDEDAQRLADDQGVMFKNSRDDRFTYVVIPEERLDLEALPGVPGPAGDAQRTVVEEQTITMTRSLGDFYPHRHGLTYEPEMRVLPLTFLSKRNIKSPLLLLASDGVWDIFDFDEVCEHLVPQPDARQVPPLETRASKFFEATRARGAYFFDEKADNLTGILLDLSVVMSQN